MGKASRRKKERKLEAKKPDSTQVKSGKKTKKLDKKKTPKKKPAASSRKKTKKQAAPQATVLNIKSQKKSKKDTTEKTGKVQETGYIGSHIAALKTYYADHKQDFVNSLDPDKLSFLKKETKTVFKGGSYFLVAILFFIVILISIELHSHNRVSAGTKAGDIDLSYQTYNQAKEKLQTGIKEYFDRPFEFHLDGQAKNITLEELGVRIGIDQTMGQMPIIDFEDTNPIKLFASVFYEQKVIPNYTFDGDKILKKLEESYNLNESRARNAKIVYGEEGFDIQQEKSGKIINRDKLINDLRNNIDNLAAEPIQLELVAEEPRITASALAEKKDELVALLDTPLRLTYEDDAMDLKLLEHLEAVNFEEKTVASLNQQKLTLPIVLGENAALNEQIPVTIASEIQVSVDLDKIEDHLTEQLIQNIDIPTSPANIYTNEEGKVVIEGKGEDGRAVSKEQLIAAIELAVNNGVSDVPVPVHVEKAPLTISDDLKELGITELLATGHSAYYGSPANRMFNINFGTEKFNGIIIGPGEQFSFNKHLGPVDHTSGFKAEKVIKKDKLEYEIGGGICQVSTTMYRALLLAGLPVLERKPHSWKVSYYGQSMGHGLDATIYPGVSDVKFENNTPGHLLVQAYTEGAEAYFKLYGTSDGRTVALDGPFGGGLTYRWNRTIAMDGEETTEEIWSKYRPIPPPEPAEKKPIAQTETTAESSGQVNFNF